jgi:hypothetical protein
MFTEARTTSFDDFLNDFAEAVEMAASGEIDEAQEALAASRRKAERATVEGAWAHGALLYRYEVAERVLGERYGAG